MLTILILVVGGATVMDGVFDDDEDNTDEGNEDAETG